MPRVPHRQRLPTSNRKRQPTLSDNPPVRLISPLPLKKPSERSPQWKLLAPNPHPSNLHLYLLHPSIKRSPQLNLLTPNPHPSNLHRYLLHPSIMSDKNHIFCAFMDVVTNSSTLRACSFIYKVHSKIIQNLLDEYYSHQLSRTRQNK